MRPRFVPTIVLLGLLCGCSSFATAVFERPQIRDEIKDSQEVVIITTTGERRITTTHSGIVCAESYPDVATAAGAVSKAAASASGSQGAGTVSGNVSDQFQTALLQTFNRTETADVVRQIGWQICQAYSNARITKYDYYALLNNLTTRAFNTLDKRASAPPVVVAGPGSVQVNLGPTSPSSGTKSTGSGAGTQPTGAGAGNRPTGSGAGNSGTSPE